MNLIIFIAALVVSLCVFAFLVRVLKAAIGTAIAIALVVLVLQLAFGVAPNQLWQEVQQIWGQVWHVIQGQSNR